MTLRIRHKERVKFYLAELLKLNIIKTLYINFRMLPLKKAIKLPIFIYYRTELVNISGKIKINGKVRPGMFAFDDFNREIFGSHHWHRIEIRGQIELNGIVRFGIGSSLFVDKDAKIVFGDNIIVGGKTKVICVNHIKFGNNIRIAFETQIIDTNFHFLRNVNDSSVENCSKPIIIGNNNWIGNRCSLMHGTETPDFTTVSSYSLLNKTYLSKFESYSVIGGIPVKLLKSGYERVFDFDEESEYKSRFKKSQL